MKPTLAIIAAVLASYLLAACNTTEGMGKDVKNTGQAIENTAKDTKQKM